MVIYPQQEIAWYINLKPIKRIQNTRADFSLEKFFLFISPSTLAADKMIRATKGLVTIWMGYELIERSKEMLNQEWETIGCPMRRESAFRLCVTFRWKLIRAFLFIMN